MFKIMYHTIYSCVWINGFPKLGYIWWNPSYLGSLVQASKTGHQNIQYTADPDDPVTQISMPDSKNTV